LNIYAMKSARLPLNCTMHIGRKPGEIMEVDWAGDTATVTDSR
jgi:hypothetical protein